MLKIIDNYDLKHLEKYGFKYNERTKEWQLGEIFSGFIYIKKDRFIVPIYDGNMHIDMEDMEERYGEELYKEYLEKENKRFNNIIKQIEEYINEEQMRLTTETSNTYEDSLDKTRYVNEDVYNELTKVLNKLEELKEKV